MDTINERNSNPIEEMTNVAQKFLSLTLWGFEKSYHSEKLGKLIYDSEICRVSFLWGGWDPLSGKSINIQYGRLHASNEKAKMIWMGEECHCWHRFEHALHFLDGRTSIDAVRLNFSHPIIDEFYKPEFREKFRYNQPEWLARMHEVVWQHYGKRFFELFDLRRPNLWQQYQLFLKEYYDLDGRIPGIKPSLDKVC